MPRNSHPDDLPQLTPDEIRRYGRHLVLEDVGVEGQRRLKAARVLLIGAGGLGSPAGLYLAAAGVGTLGLVDFDHVEETNLQRQVLYGQGDLDRPKVEVAAARLRATNPHIEIVEHGEELRADNVRDLFEGYDLIVDGSDNFSTRYLVNDACVLLGKPLVWGAVLRFEGQAAVFGLPDGPCYRCLFPEPPPPGLVPSCAEGGVLGVLPGIIGSIQANEAIKWILHRGDLLVGRFLFFDALSSRFREMRLPRDPSCPTCGDDAKIELKDMEALCAKPGRDATVEPSGEEISTDIPDEIPMEITVEDLEAWRKGGVEHRLLDVREPTEWQICRIEGAELQPLRGLPRALQEIELAKDDLVVVHCHVGGRSAQAVHYLRSQGYVRATNLAGGIEAWSLRIDPTVPRY
ncbi:MAG: molybdopterin-synthase adenylyltransferase MoeB [Thermoanaerobaculia bacterium]|nr:molybdopterin-synthase adenylyltransferase MoeB [Thermoanaerobaculia bacterium]